MHHLGCFLKVKEYSFIVCFSFSATWNVIAGAEAAILDLRKISCREGVRQEQSRFTPEPRSLVIMGQSPALGFLPSNIMREK